MMTIFFQNFRQNPHILKSRSRSFNQVSVSKVTVSTTSLVVMPGLTSLLTVCSIVFCGFVSYVQWQRDLLCYPVFASTGIQCLACAWIVGTWFLLKCSGLMSSFISPTSFFRVLLSTTSVRRGAATVPWSAPQTLKIKKCINSIR